MQTEDYQYLYELEERFWWFAGMREVTASLLNPLLPQRDRAILAMRHLVVVPPSGVAARLNVPESQVRETFDDERPGAYTDLLDRLDHGHVGVEIELAAVHGIDPRRRRARDP